MALPRAERAISGSLPLSKTRIPPEGLEFAQADVSQLTLEELCRRPEVYNRELAWLDFNWRVLQEALDHRNPLLERLTFIGITASNLDEFFRKRVGGLKRQQAAGARNLRLRGWPPDYQLKLISDVVTGFVQAKEDCLLQDILPKLAEQDVRLVEYDDLTPAEVERLRQYFHKDVFPLLTPLAFDPAHPFPFISNLSLNLVVEAVEESTGESHVARMKVPANRPRWVRIGESNRFIALEKILIQNLDSLFAGMHVLHVHPFRITRNAAMVRNEEEADDLLAMISEELQERRFAPVVRLEVATDLPPHLLNILLHEFELAEQDVYEHSSPLGLSDLMALARQVDLPHMKFGNWHPRTSPNFSHLTNDSRPEDVFNVLKQGDILLHHPYQSFANSTQLWLLAAARDPQVLAIKHTLYRTTDDSPIVDALISAAQNGKQVAVLVEVKARFDEEQNIYHSKRLEEAGCHVAYGLVGLKAHTKTSLVVREEAGGLKVYVHVGTGNYNPSTANLYTDLALLTMDEDIVSDVMNLFNYLTGYNRSVSYRKLLVAPVNMRRRFVELIERETELARNEGTGRIITKVNSLDDPDIAHSLYRASQAGVQVDLIIRGVCRVRPGIPGMSENIRVVSVVGRFLEHHRIFHFGNAGSPEYFIGSADWMQRNLDNRVEAVVPVEDEELREQLQEVLDACLVDQRNAWDMQPDATYVQRRFTPGNGNAGAEGTHSILMQSAIRRSGRSAANRHSPTQPALI